MAEEAHQWRLKRTYQFPAAVKKVADGTIAGWVLPLMKSLHPGQPTRYYGVVRYVVGGDRVAWIESPEHFGEDVTQAEQWVQQTIASLKGA